MYLTPKFNRKTLALALVCFVLTLTTFGIVLVTYFFYAQTNSLFSIEPIPIVSGESIHTRKIPTTDVYRSNANRHRDYTVAPVNPSPAKDRPPSEDLFGNNIKSNTYILANSKQDRLRLHYDETGTGTSTSSVRSNDSRADDQPKTPRTGEDTGGSRGGANSETIYIDDYDRMVDATMTTTVTNGQPDQGPERNSRRLLVTSAPYAAISDRLDINNIDYFDSILKDRTDAGAVASAGNGPMLAKLVVSSTTSIDDDSPTGGGGASSPRKKKKQRARNQQRRRKVQRQRPIATDMTNKYFSGLRLSSQPQRKNMAVTRIPLNIRRPYVRNRGHRRYDDDDDDERIFAKSAELFDDDDLIGSGSGDFIDAEDMDDLDDAEVYVAIGGEQPGRYRMESNRNENAYSVMDDGEVEMAFNQSGRHASISSRKSTGIGSVLKKWIPPSIVSSSQESRLITVAVTTTTAAPAAAAASAATVAGGGGILSATTTYPPTSVDKLPLTTQDNGAVAVASQQQQPQQQPDSINQNQPLQQKDQQEQQQQSAHNFHQNSGAWYETRARRIMGNVKKSEERSRQLLLCAEAGGGELCRMLFKGHLNEPLNPDQTIPSLEQTLKPTNPLLHTPTTPLPRDCYQFRD